MILYPAQLDFGEAVVHGLATRLVAGQSLYRLPSDSPTPVANYTPLYFWLTAGLQVVFGPGFGPGRALSLLATLLAAYCVGHLAAARVGQRLAGALAALLFLGLGFPSYLSWAALYRVDTLGVALSLGGIVLLMGGASRRRALLAGVLAGLALLTKQSLIAASLAGFIWLWRRDRTAAVGFGAVIVTLTLGTATALEATSGAFLAGVVFANANPFEVGTLVGNVTTFALFQGGPLSVAICYLLARRRADESSGRDLLALYWLASFIPLLGLGKVGATVNYWIETAAITAVLATAGVWLRLPEAGASVRRIGYSVIAALLVSAAVMTSIGGFWPNQGRSEQFQRLVERVGSEPSTVLAAPADVLTLAGRENLFEPSLYSTFYVQGRWDPSPFIDRICTGEVGMVVLDRPIETEGPPMSAGIPYWPPPVLAALRQTMVLEGQQAGRYIYVARPGSGTRCPG